MNGETTHAPPDRPRREDVSRQEDELPKGLILRTLLVTTMVAISLCFATHLILRARMGQLRPSESFPERHMAAPHDVADVRQELFRLARPRPTVQEQQRAGLAGFGWVDRGRGIVRIPIETAMQLVARRGAGGAP
jgi:hypothetical protein